MTRRPFYLIPFAAGAAEAQPPATADDSVRRIPPVTITATRNPSPVLTTPMAVTRLGADALRATSGVGLDEALSRVPGVVAQSRYGTSDIRLMIRGYGARGAGDRSNSGTTRGVRILLDGIPETEPDGRTSLDQLDLATAEAVEVIRSNASSVWGNAAGGVVNVVTMPNATSPAVEAQSVLGGFGLRRWAARTSAPVGGGGGVAWASFTNTSFDGWRAHSSARRALVNAGATGTIGAGTRLGLHLSAANNLSHIPGPLTRGEIDADPSQANATYARRDERRWNRTGRLGVTLEHAFDSTTSVATMAYANPKYLQRSERNTYRDFTRYHVGGNAIARTTVTTGGVRSRLTAGVDAAYQDGAILFYTLSPTAGRGTTLTDNKGEGARNVGLFAQDELSVGDRWSLLVGARWDDVAYDYRSFLPDPPVRADRRDFARVSPKLGVSWRVGAGHAVYANVGGGVEVPAGNETDPTPGAPPALLNPLLEPIRSTTYEIGVKSPGATFGYDVAAYDIEVTNEIVPYAAGRYYLTAGRARRQGVEVGANVATRGGAFATVALTLSRNRYRTYIVDSAVAFPTDPTKAGKRADYSGNAVVGIPDALAKLEVGAEVPGARALVVKASVDLSDDYFADDANRVRVPGFAIVDLTAELRRPLLARGGFGVRGFVGVRNLADRRWIGSAFLNPDLVNGAPAAFEPGMPRSVVVSLSVGRRAGSSAER